MTTTDLVWIDAGGGYALALEGTKLVCRNAKGARLASVPNAVKDGDVAEQLRGLVDWLAAHDRECAQAVETWMLRSLPVPRAVLEAAWPDAAWRSALENAVVVPVDSAGTWDVEAAGFLRGADAERGLGLVTIDGETVWIDAPLAAVPHPILIAYLDDFRELATELGFTQGVPQLFRETWARPADAVASTLDAYSGGRFEQLNHALGRARTLGYRVRGGWASCPVWEAGRLVEARYWIGSDHPEGEAYTGELSWVDDKERALKIAEIGPVAYSEGNRMASLIFAGRAIPKDAEEADASAAAPASTPAPAPAAVAAAVAPSSLTAAEVLAAGGLALPDATLPEALPVDTVGARAYVHPAVRDRVVVRLTAEVLAPGEDRVMDFLGFGPPEDRAAVAVQRRRALGFPGWALVNDPEHASFALEVVKEFKKHARRAASKPGFAKEGFDAVGERLGRTVPHFLPPFYEEVGRAFLDAGSATYAAQAFNKAREAERVHALAVDEDQRRQAFVDFALAGALTVKAISAYAKELEKAYSPDVAYRHFRELCLRRTLGGLPPWSGMPRELRGLAKAAGLEGEAEDAVILRQLLEAPALSLAPADFWSAYRKQLRSLASDEPAVRGTLLNLMPGSVLDAAFHDSWLELLDECGALDALTGPAGSVPEEAAPAGGPAAWFSREAAHVVGRSYSRRQAPPRLFALLRRMAGRLKSDGEAIDLGVPEWNRTAYDVDLLDLALELGVPVADPAANGTLALDAWISPREASPERPRDPAHLAGDPRFTDLLAWAVDSVIQREDFMKVARGKKGLDAARRAWFDARLAALKEGTLHAFRSNLSRLLGAISPGVLEEYPDLRPRLGEVDVAGALARTARAGLLDELGWPALDDAVDELAAGGGDVLFSGVFPYVVATDGRRAIALGARGRLLDHELRLPPKANLSVARYVGGQLLVVFRDNQWRTHAYWSGAPDEVFDVSWYAHNCTIEAHAAAELPGGGVTEGGRAVNAGDTELDTNRSGAVTDGETYWCFDWNASPRLREYDARTGERGRASLPAFLEAFAADGMNVNTGASRIYPLPGGLESTPLGSRDGMTGWRVRTPDGRHEGDRRSESEGIDGRRWTGALGDTSICVGLVDFPADDRGRPLSVEYRSLTLWDAEGKYVLADGSTEGGRPEYAGGTSVMLPVHCWHFLRPRDEAGSRALRAFPDEVARQLVDVAKDDLRAAEEAAALAAPAGGLGSGLQQVLFMASQAKPALTKTLAATAEHVGAVTNQRLRAGLAGLAAIAAAGELQLQKALGEGMATTPAEVVETLNETALASVISKIAGTAGYAYYANAPSTMRQIEETSRYFAAAEVPPNAVPAAQCSVLWDVFVGRLGAAAFLAAVESTDDSERGAILEFLSQWAALPIAGEADRLRTWTGRTDEAQPFSKGVDKWLQSEGNNRYLVRATSFWDQSRRVVRLWVLEYAPEGEFKPFGDATVDEAEPFSGGWGGRESVEAFVALARERGAVTWEPGVGAEIARRTGLTPAAATLLWLGCPGFTNYSDNFLPKDLRVRIGLKVAEAAAARNEVRSTFGPTRAVPAWLAGVYDAAVRGGAESLWRPLGEGPDDEESPVARFSRAWVARAGRRVPIPAELVVAATKELVGLPVEPAVALAAAAAPSRSGSLTRDVEWVVTSTHGMTPRDKVASAPVEEADDVDDESDEPKGDEAHFTGAMLGAVAHLVPFLFVGLPVGDPLRSNLPELLELTRARLANPGLLLSIGTFNFYDANEAKFAAQINAFDGMFGGEPYAPEGIPADKVATLRDTGELLVGTTISNTSGHVTLHFRPARVRDFAALAKLGTAAGARYYTSQPAPAMCGLVLSDGYTAIAERVRNTPVPEGQWEANPLHSARDLVAEVAGEHGVSEDGAVLYLQTLAIAEPTTKAVQTWNGWTAARYKKAAAEIAGAGLVLEAKRERAGRAHFLPGGWVPLKAPELPTENWKLSLYGVGDKKSGYAKPLKRLLPLRPLHELFAEAWARVKRGDRPEYEEV